MIVLCGYYGAGNFGDDLIMLSIVQRIKKQWPTKKVTVLVKNEQLLPAHPLLSDVRYVPRSNTKAVIDAIKNCSHFVVGGGGIFQDYSGFDVSHQISARTNGINFYSTPMEIAYLLGKPIFVFSVGIGPIENESYARHLRTVLHWASTITVRDEWSLKYVQERWPELTVHETADPVVSFPIQGNTTFNSRFTSEKKYIGICLRQWFQQSPAEQTHLVQCIAAACDELVRKYNYEILLFPFCKSTNDTKLLENVYHACEYKCNIHLYRTVQMSEALGLIQQCQLLISMRLHPLIVATTHGIPCIGLSYDPKVER
ncbi:MAG: polysaccharide pyruvyl transferase family protein, partial [Bacilli bacterium]